MRLGAAADVLADRRFRLVFAGHSISSLGDKMVPLALAFAVFQIGGSATELGIVLASATVPMVALLLVGGVWGDSKPRRSVMIASDVVRAAAQGATAVLLLGGHARVWQLAALQAIYGAASAFFTPASQGLVQEVVPRSHLQQANAFLGISRNAAGIAGPALSGALVAAAAPGWALAADSASFAASAIFLFRLGAEPTRARQTTARFFAELKGGWRAFRSRTWVWASVCHFGLFHLLVWAPLLVLGPLVANRSLGGATAWAVILGAGSAGAILGGLTAVRLRPRRPLVVVFALMLLFAPQLVLLALASPTFAIAGAALVAEAGMSALNVTWFATLQARIPADSLARITSYDWLGTALLLPLGLLVVGPLAAAVGTRTVLAGAAAWALGSSAFMLGLPAIRAFELPSRGDERGGISAAEHALAAG